MPTWPRSLQARGWSATAQASARTQERLRAAARPPMAGHRASVWIALDGVLILFGGALMIAAWQRVPAASSTEMHPSLWTGASTTIPFVVGMVLVVLGLYVLAAFFWPLPLPRTRQEREASLGVVGQGSSERAGPALIQPPLGSGPFEARPTAERGVIYRPLTDEEARPPDDEREL